MGSDLEAFSRNPTDDSFVALAFQLATLNSKEVGARNTSEPPTVQKHIAESFSVVRVREHRALKQASDAPP